MKNKKLKNSRKIDKSIGQAIRAMKSKYVLISSIEIKTWKTFLIITFAAGFTVALIWSAYNSWYIRSGASGRGVIMYSLSEFDGYKAGEQFQPQILLDTASKNIVAAQAVITYDPSMVEILSVDTSVSNFSHEVRKNIDRQNGEIFIAVAEPAPGVKSSQAKVATVTIKALKDFTGRSFTLKFDLTGAVDDCVDNCAAILDDGQGTNVLAGVTSEFEKHRRIVRPRPRPKPGPTPAPPSPRPTPTPPSPQTFLPTPIQLASVASLASNVVRLDWTGGVSDKNNFTIERKHKKRMDYAEIAQSDKNSRSFVDISTKSKQKYYYRVCQLDSSGNKQCSNEKRVKTQRRTKIYKPRLSASSADGKVTIFWQPPYTSDFTIFIQKKTGTGIFKRYHSIAAVNGGDKNFFEDTDVILGQKVSYRVKIAMHGKKTRTSKRVRLIVR